MPKKELLFIINNLNVGGAEKALISLLQTIDYSRFNVDLYLFKKEGLFLNQVPAKVNILPSPENYPYFDMSIKKALIENIKRGKFKVAYCRMMVGLIYKIEKIKSIKEQKAWRYLKTVIPSLDKKYDIAVGYLEKTPNYFCVDKVDAAVKIGFIMNDYDKLLMDKTIDKPYFEKLDYIACDSEESIGVLERNFPEFKEKYRIIKTIISSGLIKKLAQEPISDFPEGFKILSIGRLSHQKGYDLAIEACGILAKKGYAFKWYILGVGEDEQALKTQINRLELDNYFVFLGIRENHYPYLKQADIFVHTARFEGFGIVVAEAKILNKPMVLTDFNTARTHIKNGVTGLICDLDPVSIANAIEKLIIDPALSQQFCTALAEENYGTEAEIDKFYQLIGE